MELTELKKHWDAFGKTDPLWAILTQPDKRFGQWNLDEFFESGRREIEGFLAAAGGLLPGINPGSGAALDFGCGVGRLTQALCRHFGRCCGIDIAPSMIELARRYNRFGERCQYYLNEADDLKLFSDNTFDLVYSNIVLQHMEPRFSSRYIREFMRVLKPGGIAFFQLPGEAADASQNRAAAPLKSFKAAVALTTSVPELTAAKQAVIGIRVRNCGNSTWPSRGKARVRVGNHWLAENSPATVLAWDDGRQDLPADLLPGEECCLNLVVTPPVSAERAILEIDLVQEHVTWFRERGSEPARAGVGIKPSAEVSFEPSTQDSFQPSMEVYSMPVIEVRQLIERAGATVVSVREDGWAGPEWVSYQYLAAKEKAG